MRPIKHMPWPKGRSPSPEQREKISATAKRCGVGLWMSGIKPSAATVEKMRAAHLSIGSDPAERKRRSDRALSLGYGKWMAGKKASAATREKLSIARKGKSYSEIYGPIRAVEEAAKRKGGNKKRWGGVKTRAALRPYHGADSVYVDWRTSVFRRDGYKCVRCGAGGAIQAHHVQSWKNFAALRFDVLNGETLCVQCHKIENAIQRRIEGRA